MKRLLNLLLVVMSLGLLLAACGPAEAPSLAVTDQTTLVYIYTEA